MKTILSVLLTLLVVASQMLGSTQPTAAADSARPAPAPLAPKSRPLETALAAATSITDTLTYLDWVRTQEPFFADDFSDTDGPWRTETTEDALLTLVDDTYQITIQTDETLEWSEAGLDVADLLAEVDTAYIAGPGSSQFGLFFRFVDDANSYLFTISGDGMYQLYKLEEGDVDMLVDETASDAIETGRGASNRLGVMAQGETIVLLVNGYPLAEVEDDAFTEGDIALAAGTLYGSGTQIAFDNLQIWDLSALSPAPEPTAELPEPTPEAVVTEEALDAEAALQTITSAIRDKDPLLDESFTRDRGGWQAGEDESVERFFADRAYHIRVTAPEVPAWTLAEIEAADFLAEVQVAQEAMSPGSYAGLLFRYVDDENYYAFLVDGEGQFKLDKVVDGQATTLLDWERAEALAGGGGENLLGVLANGSHILLLANDVLLAQVGDESHRAGHVALAAGAPSADGIEAVFDDLAVWDAAPAADLLALLPGAAPTPVPVEEHPVFDPAALALIHAEEPLLGENFTRDRGEWSIESTEDSERSFADRAYHIRVVNPDQIGWTQTETPLADFLAEVQTTHVDGPLDGDYGLLFRLQDADNFYRFAVTGSGTYSVDKLVDGAWETLIEPTTSPLLDAGEGASNLLGVLAQGTTIVLLANDEMLASAEDDTFAAGDLALVVGTYTEPDLEVAFDDLAIWDLEPLAAQLEGVLSSEPAATPVPTEEATPMPTPEPEATEAVSAEIADIRVGAPTYSIELAEDEGWVETTSDSMVERFFADGAYHIAIQPPFTIAGSDTGIEAADFYLELDTQHVAGALDNEFGVIFRDSQGSSYAFRLTSDGSFVLDRYGNDTDWTRIVEPTPAEAIRTGEGSDNRLGLLARGSRLVLLVNDAVLAEAEDDTSAAGEIALTVTSSLSEGETEIAFRNLQVWELGPAPAEPTATPDSAQPAPTVEPVETPAAEGFSLDTVEIVWDIALDVDLLGEQRLERRTVTLPTGETIEADVIVAEVSWVEPPIFDEYTAYFYDAEGVEVGEPMPVWFVPMPAAAGEVGEALILVPEGMSEVRSIEIDF